MATRKSCTASTDCERTVRLTSWTSRSRSRTTACGVSDCVCAAAVIFHRNYTGGHQRLYDEAGRNHTGNPYEPVKNHMSADPYLDAAIEQARKSLGEGGIPIGAVLVHNGDIIGRGHNCRVQTGSAIDHGEMNCLRNAGRLSAAVYRNCTMYSTLSPCPMCSGAIVLYKIPRVVVGENRTFLGAEDYMRANGVSVDVVQNDECIRLMTDFIASNPRLWNEDIGT